MCWVATCFQKNVVPPLFCYNTSHAQAAAFHESFIHRVQKDRRAFSCTAKHHFSQCDTINNTAWSDCPTPGASAECSVCRNSKSEIDQFWHPYMKKSPHGLHVVAATCNATMPHEHTHTCVCELNIPHQTQ